MKYIEVHNLKTNNVEINNVEESSKYLCSCNTCINKATKKANVVEVGRENTIYKTYLCDECSNKVGNYKVDINKLSYAN